MPALRAGALRVRVGDTCGEETWVGDATREQGGLEHLPRLGAVERRQRRELDERLARAVAELVMLV